MKNLAKLLFSIATLASWALGQGGQVKDQAIYGGGVPNATVRVCTWSASPSVPCTPTVTIYSDRDLASGHAITNPTTSDGAGNYIFYIAPGLYTVQVSSSITSTLSQSVMVPVAPDSTGKIPSSVLPSSYATIQDEGTPLTQRDTINFTGAGITCTDSGGVTACDVPGGGGGGITGSGAAPFLALFNGPSSITSSAFFKDDGTFASICYPAGGCATGPYLQIGTSSAVGSIVMQGQSVSIKGFGTLGSGNINLRPGSGSIVTISGIAGIDATTRYFGGTSGSVDILVDPVADPGAGTKYNLTHLMQNCQGGTTCTPIPNSDAHMFKGNVSLSGGTATITSISPAFKSTTSPICWVMDKTTPANTTTSYITIASTTSITITGTGTDAVNYGCYD